jgi:hypothetical protein
MQVDEMQIIYVISSVIFIVCLALTMTSVKEKSFKLKKSNKQLGLLARTALLPAQNLSDSLEINNGHEQFPLFSIASQKVDNFQPSLH